jgi:metal transporter CNNM
MQYNDHKRFDLDVIDALPSSLLAETEWEAPDWLKLIICLALVLLGGLVAGNTWTDISYLGLTIGLMSLDETNLKILKNSGLPHERYYAAKIEPIRRKGHLLLCTLLITNTIINETLPIVMDSIFGGGVQAILISSALIVIFGE